MRRTESYDPRARRVPSEFQCIDVRSACSDVVKPNVVGGSVGGGANPPVGGGPGMFHILTTASLDLETKYG